MTPFPPSRLPPVSKRASKTIHASWFAALAFAILTQIFGLGFVVRDAYVTRPAFVDVGLASAIEYEGFTTVTPVSAESKMQGIVEGSRVLAIDGHPVAAKASAEAIAKRLRTAPAARIELRLRDPRGAVRDHVLTRTAQHRAEAVKHNPIPLDLRMAMRLFFSALGALSLIVSASLLFRLRSHDPEAILFSFAFLLMAAVIDPPMLMWMGLGLSPVIDVITGLWWTLILVAFAAFPTGHFSPLWLRWTIVAAPVLGIFLAADLTSEAVALLIGVVPPLLILSTQVVRYRSVGAGIERQQIKWAAIGFTAGFVMLGLSLGLAALPQPEWSPRMQGLFYLLVVCTFSLAFAVMPLGLLVSLLRYRLWEADAVIRKSVSYAALTLFVGFVFTLAAEATKSLVSSMFSTEHAILSQTAAAAVAAAVFSPARSFILRVSKNHFDKPLARMRALPSRLREWRQDETAAEIGMRVLATLASGIHAESAALFILTPTGKEMVAASNVPEPDALTQAGTGQSGPNWAMTKSLEDKEGPIGLLMLGPRSDGNRYNRSEREALDEVLTPLAETLRFTRSRSQTDAMRAFEARLAQLESAARLKPA